MSELQLTSPDGRLTVTFAVQDTDARQGIPTYTVQYKDRPLILASALGLELEGEAPWSAGWTLAEHRTDEARGEWRPLYGERDRYPDRYNALTVTLRREAPARLLQISFRAYDEGVAFAYTIPEQPGLREFVIAAERSQFHFPAGCHGYAEQGAEGEYHKVLIRDLPPDCERPLTVEYPDGTHVALTEARLNDYARMLLHTTAANPWVVESQLSGLLTEHVGYGNMAEGLPEAETTERVTGRAPFATPWRVLIVGERPGDLLERNYLVLNLNDPCAIEATSWIVPGKSIRDMTLSTPGAKACVDFAAAHDFQYVLLDAGWYDDPFDDRSDATRVAHPVWFWGDRRDPEHQGLDMEELVRYGEERGVGVMLYVDRRHVERQLDDILATYQRWGVKAIKFGFVNVGPQRWTRWLVEAVRKAAEHGIALNIHDAYRPTGLSRTYPNLLTQEGIRGNEHMPTARHNTTLPFTRFVAGAGDYTICYYTDRKQTSCAHQLGMAVVTYSPMHTLLWYDRPADARGEVELAFFAQMPTVWDETRVLAGAIGEYAAIARRRGEAWFVGCITNEEGRELTLPLDFLTPGRGYSAQIYADGFGKVGSRTDVAASERQVDASTELLVVMAPSGGQALRIVPQG